jgi:uncharacterized metal-binding protein YceD (DUF177 family)
LGDLLCDELILTLPVVARHGDRQQCVAGNVPLPEHDPAGVPGAGDRRQPFAGLRDLLDPTNKSEQE